MNWNSSDQNNTGVAGSKVRNIYARGADDGFWMGLYFSVMFILTVCSLSMPPVNIVVAVMVIGVPVLTYFFLRRTHVAMHGMSAFSALWMQGIVTFGCGCLILGAVSFVYLRWIDPGFMTRVLEMGVDFYRASDVPSADMLADELQMIIDSKAVPTALNAALGWMWLGMFSGSILSLFMALIVRLKKVGPSSVG